jgi:transcriptional regulator with GAF, ATPase, and Fis domain
MEKVAVHYKWPDSSVVVGRLVIQHNFIGSLIVRANGKDRYSEEHAKLWSLVNEPAGIALANSRQNYELVKAKDHLADDNRYLQNELRRNWGEKIVGAGFGLREMIEQVVKVAPFDQPRAVDGRDRDGQGGHSKCHPQPLTQEQRAPDHGKLRCNS